MVFALLAASVQGRTSYNFDFGWKFHLGNVNQPDSALCPDSGWSKKLDGMYCPGWAHQAAYQLTMDECRLYCCGDPVCAGYLSRGNWCVIGADISGCFVGNSTQKPPHETGWQGQARSTPAAVPQPASNGPQSAAFDDLSWDNITVPHDYVISTDPSADAEKNHGYRFKNISWYRKTFELPASTKGQVLYLEFDGVYRSSDMWLNGEFLGHHSSGYTSFRYRIDNVTSFKQTGANVLSVRTDPRANEGWWYEGGGLYRHVRVVAVSPTHVKPWGVYVPSNVVGRVSRPSDSTLDGLLNGTAGAMTADATVDVFTDVVNLDSSSASFTVTSTISSPTAILWTASTAPSQIPANGEHTSAQQTGTLSRVPLWDISRPVLLTLNTVVKVGGTVVDTINTTFGVRKTVFDKDTGFYLNDNPVKVKGMCNHQDFAGVGTAIPDSISDYRVRRLQSVGANAWRMSHNPPAPELLDATDRLGFMVWDENRMFGDFPTWYDDQRDMILRDRNHPSIIW
jgi:beta-galactosidase/beta-glucuronidase